MDGLIGQKLGMTQVFDREGRRLAVTVIEAGPCVVVQRRTREKDGYDAVQLGYRDVAERRTTKAMMGHFKKAQVTPLGLLKEVALDAGEDPKPGETVTVKMFEGVTHVDVIGVTKGRGFQGVVRRHGMRGGPMTHGGHSKRRIGSVGANAWEARVYRGHRMPGHMGNVLVTTQNLRVAEIRGDDNLILVCGAVPGPTGAAVLVRKALKKRKTGKAQ